MNWGLQLPQRQKNKKIMRYPFGEDLNGYFFMNYFTVVIYQEEVSMTNELQQYFPMIRTEEEVLSEINSRSHLKQMYEEWEEEEQRELSFCSA